MAYTPKDWETGEIITEEALDHMEQGIANAGVLMISVTATYDDVTGNPIYTDSAYSASEIYTAMLAGKIPVVVATSYNEETGLTTASVYMVNSCALYDNDSSGNQITFMDGYQESVVIHEDKTVVDGSL